MRPLQPHSEYKQFQKESKYNNEKPYSKHSSKLVFMFKLFTWILDSFDSHKQHTSSFKGIIFHFPTSTRDDNTKQLTQNMVNQCLLIETESFCFHCHSQTSIYF